MIFTDEAGAYKAQTTPDFRKRHPFYVRSNVMIFMDDYMEFPKEMQTLKAIPHKERTAKRSGKRYNKEVKKQLTMSLISDELGQATTKKSSVIRKLVPSKRATSGTSATRSTSAWMRTADWFTRWKQQPLSYIEIGSKAHTRFHQKYGYKNFINIRTVMDEF